MSQCERNERDGARRGGGAGGRPRQRTSTTRSVAQTSDVIVRGEVGARVDTFLTRAALHGLSGAIVVAQRGEVVLRKGYGVADRERGVTVGPETPFFIGSLAKQFTAAAVLRLAADGKLALDDSLGTFFPDAPADKRGITVRQLLSHTSGLPYLPSAGLFGARHAAIRSCARCCAERLLFAPGSRYEYSTPGLHPARRRHRARVGRDVRAVPALDVRARAPNGNGIRRRAHAMERVARPLVLGRQRRDARSPTCRRCRGSSARARSCPPSATCTSGTRRSHAATSCLTRSATSCSRLSSACGRTSRKRSRGC